MDPIFQQNIHCLFPCKLPERSLHLLHNIQSKTNISGFPFTLYMSWLNPGLVGLLNMSEIVVIFALWDPTDCSPSGSSVHGILQTRILECIVMTSSKGSSQPRIESMSLTSPALVSQFFTTSTTWETLTGHEDSIYQCCSLDLRCYRSYCHGRVGSLLHQRNTW